MPPKALTSRTVFSDLIVAPAKAQGCPEKSCGDEEKEIASPISSWPPPGYARDGPWVLNPGVTRPSTALSGLDKDVDARIKSAQDDVFEKYNKSDMQEKFDRIAMRESWAGPGEVC
jgi:hypothetical protein